MTSRAHFRSRQPAAASTAVFPIAPDLSRFGSFSQHPHKVLRQKGLAYLEELEQDTQLKSQLDTRFKQAIVPGWIVEPAAQTDPIHKTVADFVRMNLAEIEGTFYADLYALFDAVGKGFSVMEPVWQPLRGGTFDGYLRLRKLKHIPAKHVRFDLDEFGEIKPDGIVFWPEGGSSPAVKTGARFRYDRFIHVTHGKSESPYGEPVDIDCAFWVWIKKNIAKYWAFYAETFGMPAVKVTLPASAGAKTDASSDEAMARKIAEDIRAASGLVVPKGFAVEFLEAVRQGDVGFDNFLNRCDNEIAKRVNGNVLGTGTGGRGVGASYAIGKVHSGVGDTYAYADALWCEYLVNSQIIRRIVDFNFDVNLYPKFKLLDDSLASRVGEAQTIQSLVASGAQIPLRWAHDRFNIPLPDADEPILTPQSGLASFPKPQGVDNKLFADAPAQDQKRELPARFSTDQTTRVAVLNRIERQAYADLLPALQKIVTEVLSKTSDLQEGVVPTKFPELKLRSGFSEVKQILMRAAFLHYCYGKAAAANELTEHGLKLTNLDQPFPEIPDSFRAGLNRFAELPVPADLLSKLEGTFPLTSEELAELETLFANRFHAVTGIIRADVEKIWNTQLLSLREGWTLRDFAAAVNDQLITYVGDVFGQAAAGEALSGRHIELIYRMAMGRAYAEGKDAFTRDPDVADQIWGYQMVAILDSRVRPEHAALDGVTLPKDHPFWNTYTPPYFYNCRCDREFVTVDDIQSGRYAETSVPADLPEHFHAV